MRDGKRFGAKPCCTLSNKDSSTRPARPRKAKAVATCGRLNVTRSLKKEAPAPGSILSPTKAHTIAESAIASAPNTSELRLFSTTWHVRTRQRAGRSADVGCRRGTCPCPSPSSGASGPSSGFSSGSTSHRSAIVLPKPHNNGSESCISDLLLESGRQTTASSHVFNVHRSARGNHDCPEHPTLTGIQEAGDLCHCPLHLCCQGVG